jgi:arylsulfatase A-like enzyme
VREGSICWRSKIRAWLAAAADRGLLLATACIACIAPAAPSVALAMPLNSAADSGVVCDLYADSLTGSDQFPGSAAVPFRTVQKLSDSLNAGQVGCLRGPPASGVTPYEENPTITRGGTSDANRITIRSEPGQTATIRGRITVSASASFLNISNLIVDSGDAGSQPSANIDASSVTLSDVNITSRTAATCVLVGDGGVRDRVALRRNRIHNCSTGIELKLATLAGVENNLVYDNIDRGIRIGPNADYSIVWRNVIDGNGEGVQFTNSATEAPSYNMTRDNIVSNSTTRYNIASSWTGTTPGAWNYVWRHCVHATNVDSGYNANRGIEAPSLGFRTFNPFAVGDPKYRDRRAKDFGIDTSSPCHALTKDATGNDIYTNAISGGVPSDSQIPDPTPARKPNILFIVTDDQRADTTIDAMPRTQKWFLGGTVGSDAIAGGTRYDQAFATTPLCCPSRSSIFSGRYAHNHNVRKNPPLVPGAGDAARAEERANHPLIKIQPTVFTRYLHERAGYRTGIFGKYFNGWRLNEDPPHFDASGMTEQIYCPVRFKERGVPIQQPGSGPLGTQPHRYCPPGATNYVTHYVEQEGVDFINQAESNDSQPWFLYLAPYAPHENGRNAQQWQEPPLPEAKYSVDQYPRSQLPSQSGFTDGQLEADLTDKPNWVRTFTDTRQIFDKPFGGQTYEGFRTAQMRSLKSVDDLVDRVLSTLRANGEERDTLAVYISDNGFLWREHGDARTENALDPTAPAESQTQPVGVGLSAKGRPYTDDVRVPMFMRWPGNPNVSRGFVDKRLTGNIDLAPTAVQSAGIAPDPTGDPAMDGHSLLDPPSRARILNEAWPGGPTPAWAAIRTEHYHFIEHYLADVDDPGTPDVDESKTVIFREFYDLDGDPFELVNVYGPDDGNLNNDPPSNPPAATLSATLAADRTCSGTNCP